MINFEKIWKDQKDFEANFFNFDKMSLEDKQKLTKEMILCINSETNELLKNMNWKHHREENVRIIESNILEELIDMLKFWMALCQIWKFEPTDIEAEYWRKTDVVKQRYAQEKLLKLSEKTKIVAIDIDGILSDYPDCFVKFANKKLSKKYANLFELKKEESNTVIDELKHEYRSCGVKAHLPVNFAAPRLTKILKDAGYTIVLTSARPYKIYNRIFSDTLIWLKKNKIFYDYIVWDAEKHIQVIRNYPKMEFMIEDEAKYANEVAACGYKVYLLNTPYNKFDVTHQNVVRVFSFHEILEKEGLTNEHRNFERQHKKS